MGFIAWLKERLGMETVPLSGFERQIFEDFESGTELYARELALFTAVNLVSNAVSMCKIRTFRNKNEEYQGDEWFLWNVEPNRNQNSAEFMKKLISTLYLRGECLVVEHKRELFVADSWSREPHTSGDLFSQVTVEDVALPGSLKAGNVLYWRSGTDLSRVLTGFCRCYAKLMKFTVNSYQKGRGTRGVFHYDTLPVKGTREEEAFNELIGKKFKDFLASSDAILPLGRGQTYTEMGSKAYAQESSRDIRALIDDVYDMTAKAFGIPAVLLRGDTAGTADAVDSFLTFCVDPLMRMLEEEINRKRVGRARYLAGNRVSIDTRTVKHIDLLSVSGAVDKLISSGSFSINEVRRIVGEPGIDEPWADEHYITKNYQTLEDALRNMEGGETL
jgi:HK97 family phage portal protein